MLLAIRLANLALDGLANARGFNQLLLTCLILLDFINCRKLYW